MNKHTSIEGLNNSPSRSDESEPQFAAPESVFSGSLRAFARSLGVVIDDGFESDIPSSAVSSFLEGSGPAPLGSLPGPLHPVSNYGMKPDNKANSGNATVFPDTLTITFPGHHFDGSIRAVGKWLLRWTCGAMMVGGEITKRFNGYPKCHALILADGTPAPNLGWVGISAVSDNMRGRWCVHLTGVACRVLNGISKQLPPEVSVYMGDDGRYAGKRVPGRFVTPWELLYEDCQPYDVRITRIDLAADDLTGEHSVASAVEMYDKGYFAANGRPPKTKHITTSQGEGETFYVGKTKSGKLLCIYDKGKQMGCPESLWVRWEVRLLSTGRHIPYEILVRPQSYMRGSYPRVLQWIGGAASYIATKVNRGRLLLERAIKFGKQQVGSLMTFLRESEGMDDGAIVGELIGRPGRHPLRLFEYELPDGPWESPFNARDDRSHVLAAAARLGIVL